MNELLTNAQINGVVESAKTEMTNARHIVSFSGGKDSTAMLLMMLDKGMRVDRVICVDTTKEFPEMYAHIAKVQELIKPITIEIVKFDFDYWMATHVKTKGKRKGEKGYGWPDFRNRWCTSLKRDCISKAFTALRADDVIEYHGIAYDERRRALRNNDGRVIKYPLIDMRVTGAQALEYCYKRGLDWGGLYEKFHRVSCFCCPLARIGELETIYNDFPELWQEIKTMDANSFRDFRYKQTVGDLELRFNKQKQQKKEII